MCCYVYLSSYSLRIYKSLRSPVNLMATGTGPSCFEYKVQTYTISNSETWISPLQPSYYNEPVSIEWFCEDLHEKGSTWVSSVAFHCAKVHFLKIIFPHLRVYCKTWHSVRYQVKWSPENGWPDQNPLTVLLWWLQSQQSVASLLSSRSDCFARWCMRACSRSKNSATNQH